MPTRSPSQGIHYKIKFYLTDSPSLRFKMCKSCFLVLDKGKAYQQVYITEQSHYLSAFITPWVQIPLELTNASAVFQKCIEECFEKIRDEICIPQLIRDFAKTSLSSDAEMFVPQDIPLATTNGTAAMSQPTELYEHIVGKKKPKIMQ